MNTGYVFAQIDFVSFLTKKKLRTEALRHNVKQTMVKPAFDAVATDKACTEKYLCMYSSHSEVLFIIKRIRDIKILSTKEDVLIPKSISYRVKHWKPVGSCEMTAGQLL